MAKKISKKEAYKIIEEAYSDYDTTKPIKYLCISCPKELLVDWRSYWKVINTERLNSIYSYIREVKCHKDRLVNTHLTRLLILNYFIEDTYK